MIAELPLAEATWLSAFFAAPNQLTWEMLQTDAVPALSRQVIPWLDELARTPDKAAVVLPMVQGGAPIGWYATTVDLRESSAFAAELKAWLGPSYLKQFEPAREGTKDARVRALRTRFGGRILIISGASSADNARIAERLIEFARLRSARPLLRREISRPVGRIRADFDRALLAQDEHRATELIAELRATGRLNEENLRYLDVRMQAGLGYWPQIARNHWLIATLSDLATPPQTLADLVEALYRTFVEPLEAEGDLDQLLRAFEENIARPYPRLFASRRGIRAPHVVKAFLLHERLQPKPALVLIEELLGLLPEAARTLPWVAKSAENMKAQTRSRFNEDDGDSAFDDAQYDRAFEFYLALPAGKKSLNRLIFCAYQIGDEAKVRLADWAVTVDPKLIGELSAAQQGKLAGLRLAANPAGTAPQTPEPANSWLAWAEQLKSGTDLSGAARALERAVTNWDVAPFMKSEALSTQFADLIGGLSAEAEVLAREAVSTLINAFFPPGATVSPTLRPIASVLFLLIAMDDPLSNTDLEVLAQVLSHRLTLGLASGEYVSMVDDLRDVQSRVTSYDTLPWSLDACEAVALAPASSGEAREARLRFFMQVLGQTQAFAHRLQPSDLVSLELLSKDFGVDEAAFGWVGRVKAERVPEEERPDLSGKTIGIYTLAQSAGDRAKALIESMFPGCKVEVNSDLVCTAKLTNLAKAADLFVFAWKSSSHQAFFCVKDALAPREPIWPGGKGTASILRAVTDYYT
ncbi:MAG TPA: protein DpdD [Candidatus Binataceae bacterium]|nr:protein DpdD [Candidatus Binataceae bacterium]